jgi:general stress protein YciG
MAGTIRGGNKANATITAKLGPEAAHAWRSEIGRKGGKISRGGGFTDREYAQEMGRKSWDTRRKRQSA